MAALVAAGTLAGATGTAKVCRAQTPVLVPRPPAAPDYVLGPGDQVEFHVIDMEEISDKPVRIDPSGYVDVPLAGKFQASGLTMDQFKAELAKRLSRYITNPAISVKLTDDQSRSVSVVGAVNAPGVRELTGPKRLIDVISLAGGARNDAGSRVIVTREQKWGKLPLPGATVDLATGTSTGSVSLDDLMASRNPANNIVVDPNDIVSIPKAEIVYVLGDVGKPSGFQLSSHPTISILQALSLAGGQNRDAKLSDAKIIRPAMNGDGLPTEIPVNIKQILESKARDLPLEANDVLYVPSSALKSGARRAAEAILQAATGVAIYRF